MKNLTWESLKAKVRKSIYIKRFKTTMQGGSLLVYPRLVGMVAGDKFIGPISIKYSLLVIFVFVIFEASGSIIIYSINS